MSRSRLKNKNSSIKRAFEIRSGEFIKIYNLAKKNYMIQLRGADKEIKKEVEKKLNQMLIKKLKVINGYQGNLSFIYPSRLLLKIRLIE